MRTATVAAVLLCVCTPVTSEQPKPGTSDTFALDTYVRRNVHPLSVKLIEHAGVGGEGVPVTFGLACGEGDFALGQLCPVFGGQPLPAQVDVRATWPGDGTIRHVLVSLLVPTIGPNQTLELTFEERPTPKPPPFALATEIGRLTVKTEFNSPGGNQTVS